MPDEGIGLFRALWRFFTFYKLRKATGLVRAANRQFTGSVQGISDAVDITREEWIREFNGLRDAVAQVENVLEDKRTALEAENEKEKVLLDQREGALRAAEKHKDKNPDEYAKAQAAFQRYQTAVVETEARQATLEKQIAETAEAMKKHMLRLTEFQAKIQALPEEKAKLIADHVSNKALIALNDRLSGLQSSLESGPLDEVRKANRELSAKARISEKLAGTDSRLQDEDYARLGRESASDSSFEAMLAARKAEREAKSGVRTTPAVVTEASDGRPRI